MVRVEKFGERRAKNLLRFGVVSLALLTSLSGCVGVQRPMPPANPSASTRIPHSAAPVAPAAPKRPLNRHAPIGLENLVREQWQIFPGRTGVAIMRIDGGEWITGQRATELFPQQSVSKTWVALTILDLVDQGKVSLDQKIRITTNDLAVFHQPIRDRGISNGGI